MSDEDEPVTADREPDDADATVWSGADFVLQLIVKTMSGDLESNGVGLTLTVAGQVVTGQVITRDRFFKLSQQLAHQHGFPAENAFGLIGDKLGAVLDDETLEAVSWVHLASAQYVTGNGLVPTEPSMIWRGRIHDVSGWSLGTFNAS